MACNFAHITINCYTTTTATVELMVPNNLQLCLINKQQLTVWKSDRYCISYSSLTHKYMGALYKTWESTLTTNFNFFPAGYRYLHMNISLLEFSWLSIWPTTHDLVVFQYILTVLTNTHQWQGSTSSIFKIWCQIPLIPRMDSLSSKYQLRGPLLAFTVQVLEMMIKVSKVKRSLWFLRKLPPIFSPK